MKPPKGPFWAWIDFDGSGEKWHLAFITHDGDQPIINYPMDEFEDYWYDDDWTEEEIKLIETPSPLKT